MDPLSLSVNIYTVFKEVFLVAKFIHRTVLSAKNHTVERKELRLEFEYELLFLQSMGRIYLAESKIVNDPHLNERWLKHVFNILERMRHVCSDYARVAAEDDSEYRQYSPYLNREMSDTKAIEFDINQPLPSLPEPTFFSFNALRWLGIRSSKKVNHTVFSWKWALLERKKFEEILRRFQNLNAKLKDVLPLYSATHATPTINPSMCGSSVQSHEKGSERLGIARHMRLRELSSTSNATEFNFNLKDVFLEADSNSGTLLPGLLSKSDHRSSQERVLVEYKNYLPTLSKAVPETADVELHRQPVHQLASLLSSAGSQDMSTLPLRGVIEQKEEHRHAFIFNFPPGVDQSRDPISLLSLMDGKKVTSRLELFQRFSIANRVAKHIGAFHADGWVHKSIRSESIVFFHNASSKDALLISPFLVNFEYSRPETAMTKYDSDNDLERNLYRHPERQGQPQITFSKKHDIYALGVVLLEIGLWEPARDIFKRVGKNIGPEGIPSPTGMQRAFIYLAENRLAHHMGRGYVDAVLTCLSGKLMT